MTQPWILKAVRESSLAWLAAHHRLPIIVGSQLGSGVRFGVEVGVAFGGMSLSLLQTLPMLNLLAVDPYVPYDNEDEMSLSKDKMHELFIFTHRRVNTAYPGRWRLVRKSSLEAAATVPDGWLDFVFLDGDHRYESVTADIRAWLPKVRKGGLICGHDYTPGWPGVIQAVQEAADTLDAFTHARVDVRSACWFARHG